MIKILLILGIVICVPTVKAQATSAPLQSSAGQSEPRKLTADQSAELDEANRLSAKVVELHKEAKYDEALALG